RLTEVHRIDHTDPSRTTSMNSSHTAMGAGS
ncbi:MAG: hypothetical protein QOC74_833, partial [Pseudonocardiales bacterium]|nr:hypothetical protein [Pseudonocardiales bacterium]